MTRARSPGRLRAATTRAAIAMRALVRRMAVSASQGGAWQLDGYTDESEADVEVFQGIGFSSRPESGSDAAEVIVLRVGGKSHHPVVVATRDESMRVDLDDDETAIYNSASIVKVKADGTIEIGSRGGSPSELALKSDVAAIVSAIGSAGVVAGDGGAAFKANLSSILSLIPVGTGKLKAE